MNLTKEVKDRYSENFESLNEKVGDVRKWNKTMQK